MVLWEKKQSLLHICICICTYNPFPEALAAPMEKIPKVCDNSEIHKRTYEKVNKHMTDSQIGARKNKGVGNHLFILNLIISYVLSSKKKKSIDLNIMDLKQMFDWEQLEICMNLLYEKDIQDNIFSLIHEANKSNFFQ